ncbi:MAG: polyprenyl synthetase family protein [Victivallales bacterium]
MKIKFPVDSCGLDDVRGLIVSRIGKTSLAPLLDELAPAVASGKMLRAKLALAVGNETGAARDLILAAAAAVEMVHAASLLHDDVIDGSSLRRGSPSFWRRRGASGAVILGDLILCDAVVLIHELGDPELMKLFLSATRDLCEAEAGQELLSGLSAPSWENCLDVARGKTGALFSFASTALAGDKPDIRLALSESGYEIGTAYQIADDIYDAHGDICTADKNLGSDAEHGKITAAYFLVDPSRDPAGTVRRLCESSLERLKPWRHVAEGWSRYLESDFMPQLDFFLAGMASDDKL